MKNLTDIANELKDFTFTTYSYAVVRFLTAFDFPESTIKRLSSVAEDGRNNPVFVYRKAVFLYSHDVSIPYVEHLSLPYKNIPLIIVFTSKGVFCKKQAGLSYYEYEKISEHVEEFSLLVESSKGQKDVYSAQDFGELIASIYNTLQLSGNSKENSISGIFDIINVALFVKGPVKRDIISLISSPISDFNSCYQNIQALCVSYSFGNNVPLLINSDSFKYIRAILEFDSSRLDIEVLSSLVYKLFSDDATIYGPQTSYINVQKVIQPLFINSWKESLEESPEQYEGVAEAILSSCYLDPTNGPGCFLSVAYSETRDILKEIDQKHGTDYLGTLKLNNYVALVDNEIAAKLTRLSLAYSAAQYIDSPTSEQIQEIFNDINVVICSQLEVDWSEYTKNQTFTFIFGSPRFCGFKKLPNKNKEIVKKVFGKNVSDADYCSAWLVKTASYFNKNDGKASFVMTNSIVQGSQVAEIWKTVYSYGCEIFYAYTSFKWKPAEVSSVNIGVTVVVVGIQKRQEGIKLLYQGDEPIQCHTIGPYLIPDNETIVERANSNLFSVLPSIRKGNMPYDGGHLLIDTRSEYENLTRNNNADQLIKTIVGSEEFIKATRRWCLWVPDDSALQKATEIEAISARINSVKEFRASSTATDKCKDNPHQFREIFSTDKGRCSLVIPSVSSENRPYIPTGFINEKTIVSNLAFAVYNCEPWVLPIVSSSMHMLWMKTVCGALETRYRYSNVLCYNTFPLPYISSSKKDELSSLAFQLINVRERYCDKSLGDLYSNMPQDLSLIHERINTTIDSLYQEVPFSSDVERLACLMNLYKTKVQNG